MSNTEKLKEITIHAFSETFPFLEYYRKKLKDEIGILANLSPLDAAPPYSAVISYSGEIQKTINKKLQSLLKEKEFAEAESFTITKYNRHVLIVSKSISGLLCGLVESYHQLKKDIKSPSLENVLSSPAVKNRFYHICMSGSTPNIKSLLELIRKLRFLKYNGIILEFENKYPYAKNNSFLHPNHYTTKDITRIRKTASEFGIQITPLVQCLGHLEFLLKYDEFKNLCEKKGHVSSACPLNPKTFELFKFFANEILSAFPETKYFHIGADEVRVHGECPKCRKHEAQNGKYSAFAYYIKKTTDFLLDKGVVPMMWDDIVYRHYPDVQLKGLSKKTIIVNWDYWTKNSKKATELIFVPDRIGITTSRKRLFNTEKFMAEENDGEKIEYEASEFFENHAWEKMKIYDFIKTPDFPYTVKAFPVIEMIKKDGFVPAGASNVRKSLQGTDNQDFIQRVLNNKAWAEKAKSAKIDFFIATSWGRANSLKESVFNMELMIYTLASGGYFSWEGGGSLKDFDKYFDSLVDSFKKPKLSITLQELFKGLYSIRSEAFYSLVEENIPKMKASKKPFYEMLYLYCVNFIFNMRYESYTSRLKKFLYKIELEKNYPQIEKNKIFKTLKRHQKEIEAIEKEARRILKKYVLVEEAEELAISLFHYKKKELNLFYSSLK
jgi:glycosyl hydrolase family 20